MRTSSFSKALSGNVGPAAKPIEMRSSIPALFSLSPSILSLSPCLDFCLHACMGKGERERERGIDRDGSNDPRKPKESQNKDNQIEVLLFSLLPWLVGCVDLLFQNGIPQLLHRGEEQTEKKGMRSVF